MNCARCGSDKKNWYSCPICGFEPRILPQSAKFDPLLKEHSCEIEDETMSEMTETSEMSEMTEDATGDEAPEASAFEATQESFTYQPTEPQSPPAAAIPQKTYGMKWYKFLKVCLWFSMVSALLSAFSYFSGQIYGDMVDNVYAMVPELETLSMLSGLYSLFMVVFSFITWKRLHDYRKNAPGMLISIYVLNAAFSVAYLAFFTHIVENAYSAVIYSTGKITNSGYYYTLNLYDIIEELTPSTIITVIALLVMIIINASYFKKRSDSFIY